MSFNESTTSQECLNHKIIQAMIILSYVKLNQLRVFLSGLYNSYTLL